jgi:2-aminoadipate transaminase
MLTMTSTASAAIGATSTAWHTARRAERLNPSVIREILKITERPGIISLAGGLPAPESFPVQAMREACQRVLADTPREALQYAASEGYGPLCDWVAGDLARQGLKASASQILITTGSQQGLDLVGKLLIDAGSRVAVEAPTYLGALQAFAPYEPEFVPVACDEQGPLPQGLDAARGARFLYLLPNFQNPSGRSMGAARRQALVQEAQRIGLPLVEDNPYGELWFDAAPPPPISAAAGDGAIYLGSFSKVLAPGLRLGYVVAPPALYPKLLQAKQAADLHTPGFNQRVAFEVIRNGFLDEHLPLVRARYKLGRDAMRESLERHMPTGCRWNVPAGGMFFWVELPPSLDATALLPQAVEAGMAYVPGAPFYCDAGGNGGAVAHNTLRLSFVTVSPERIDTGIAALATVLSRALSGHARSQGTWQP